ncbi:hypothetical protein BCS86_04475 [Vibrio splendidus]|nr:hypothetical protein OAC_18550 [Vibrio cyclitrophicus 1F273]PMP37149.1 hypothetical protein BCS86_04475 [Vibrio splendidus]
MQLDLFFMVLIPQVKGLLRFHSKLNLTIIRFNKKIKHLFQIQKKLNPCGDLAFLQMLYS